MFTRRVSILLILLPFAGATETWLETRIAGQPAGYIHELTEKEPGGGSLVISESKTVINRLGSKVEVKGLNRTTEDVEGHLLSLHSEFSSSAQTMMIDGTVGENVLALKVSTGGKEYTRSIPLKSPLTGPNGAQQLTLRTLRMPGDSVTFEVFSPELGAVQSVTRRLMKVQDDALIVEEGMTGLPGKTTLQLDREGAVVRRAQDSPFGIIESQKSSREQAMAGISGATLPDEAFTRTIIRSNIRLPHERDIEQVRLQLTHRRPQVGWPNFASEYQRVIQSGKEKVTIEINRPGHGRGDATAGEAYLKANALFQADDAEVQRIAHEVADAVNDPFRKAIALRDWVSANMRFDAGIAVAPASEVVRNRGGTCFGYSILLGSLARAAGLPSRMRMGFVYVSGVWAGHAWIEMLIDSRWLPFDAAATSPNIADAARIGFFTGSLEEGTITGLGSLAQMFGNVDIAIERYQLGGRQVEVPANAPAFTIDGNRYRNPWLGLELEKPTGYRFTATDSVWPAAAVLALEGPGPATVSIDRMPRSAGKDADAAVRQYLAKQGLAGISKPCPVSSRRGFCITDSEGRKAAMVLISADEAWIIRAEAPQAAALLKQVNQRLKLPVPSI